MNTREYAINVINTLSDEQLNKLIELIIVFKQEKSEPKLKADVLLAIEETEQIINEYKNGMRQPKPYKNASDFLQDILDEEDEDDV